MSNNKRIFIAAWDYPPILSGESIVCKKTLNHSHFDYDVCCGPIKDKGNEHVRLFPIKGNKYLHWPFRVLQKFRELDKNENYDIFMSRVMPPNGHLAGWLLKRYKPNTKWIAYFSDPIWNSPFLKFGFQNRASQRPSWWLMKTLGIPAKWALSEADVLIFNNQRLAHYVLGRKYELYKPKVVIAPYGHEGVKFRSPHNRNDKKIRLTHVGQIYGNRSLKSLIAGILLVRERRPDLFCRLSVRQVGFVCKKEWDQVEKAKLMPCFTKLEPVPYEKSIAEMYDADILLVIDPVFRESNKNFYVPGKIYDYMSTGRPILCLAEKDSATGDIAEKIGCMIAPQEAEAIFQAICRLFNTPLKTDLNAYGQYDCGIGVAATDQAIQTLLSKQTS